MRLKHLPAFFAVILYCLPFAYPPLALISLALGWACLLYSVEGDYHWTLKIGLGLAAFILAALLSPSNQWPLFQSLAWVIYVLARPLWGRQRSYLAFLFLFLSAEALPYYLNQNPFNLSLNQNLTLYSWPYSLAWLVRAGDSLASFQILLTGLFCFLSFEYWQANRKINYSLFGLNLLSLLIPFGFALSASQEELLALTGGLNRTLRSPMDQFMARLSFFLSFFLILFALVRKLLPEKNADDRFT